MKLRNIFIPILMLVSANVLAQKQGLGIHLGAYDFMGPQNGNYLFNTKTSYEYSKDVSAEGLPQQLVNDTVKKSIIAWQPLARITYWFQLNRYLDFNLGLSLADVQYPASGNDSLFQARELTNTSDRRDRFLGELDARINFNILERDKHFASPYIFAGITASYHDIFMGADFPAGIGVNLRMDKNLYLNVESSYKVALTQNDFNHLQHTIGVVYWFKPGYRAPKVDTNAPVMPVVSDMDKDGVPDSADQCPTIAGLPEFNGCPDTDNDGIPDNNDACPLVAGLKQFEGCPDSDNDGIPDNTDKCPYVAGTAQYNGCPPPDRDHDGVYDDVDKCPDQAGPASNDGCPEIKKEVIALVEKAAHSVYFETAKATLKKSSYKSLNKIAKVMKDDPTLYIDIAGYTDNVGKADYNMDLSDKRANACRDYLISQGISPDRMTAKGYGETHPIADNNTALGRAQNRRTEFKLRNYK